MRVFVVVVYKLGQDLLELMAMEYQHPVQALPSNSSDEPLREPVRPSRQLHLIETVRPELSG